MNTRYRIAGIAVLTLLLLGSCVLYGVADRWSYPSGDAIATEPGAYDGQEIMLFAEVAAVDEQSGTVRIVVEGRPIDVRGVEQQQLQQLGPQAAIQVYGRLRESGSVVEATRIVVDYPTVRDRQYTWLTSLCGAVLAVGVFLRYWRIDLRGLRFQRRGEH